MAWIAIFSLILTSCSKDEVEGTDTDLDNVASLTLGPVLNDTGRQEMVPQCSDEEPAFAQIRLEYGDGPTVIETIVPIGMDEDGLFTLYSDDLEIPIPSGETTVDVTLTDFVVWSDDGFGNPGMVIWIAPKDGSEYAQFVDDPLDNEWTLRAGSKNYQEVEVICFDDREVNLYGYQFFDITPKPLYEFCIFANYCSDEGRHYTANYEFALYYYDGNREDGKGEMIYEGLTPMTGNDNGTFWADPLCVAIPGYSGDDTSLPYLVFEATLTDWPGYYGDAGGSEPVISTEVSWDLIESLLNRDGDDETVNYWHIFFNCDEDDRPSGNAATTPI
ncbi:hypothetical protein E0K83_14150 [Gramella sp. BOM4]|nr:hypothetical protein [Christiangramia bathymodioli]